MSAKPEPKKIKLVFAGDLVVKIPRSLIYHGARAEPVCPTCGKDAMDCRMDFSLVWLECPDCGTHFQVLHDEASNSYASVPVGMLQ